MTGREVNQSLINTPLKKSPTIGFTCKEDNCIQTMVPFPVCHCFLNTKWNMGNL